MALSLCPLRSRQLIVCNPTPRNTPERLSEPIRVLTLSLVEPEDLLVLPLPYRIIRSARDLRRNAPAVRGIGVIVYLLSEEMDFV